VPRNDALVLRLCTMTGTTLAMRKIAVFVLSEASPTRS